MSSPRAWPRMGATVGICLAALAVASPALPAADDEFVIFTWGDRYRVLGHEVDFEGGRMRLIFGGESSMDIPLSSVSKIIDIDREVVLDLTLDGATMDAWDPPDASLWSPIQGWSSEEVWRPRGSHPRWAFRWTNSKTAWAVVAEPPDGAEAIELRLLSISHPIRVLGKVQAPEPQSLRVSLNGKPLGEIALRNRGWRTYRLELPGGCHEGTGFLKLEASYLARPTEFTSGLSQDGRELGVAVDYVRFVPAEPEGLPQGLAR